MPTEPGCRLRLEFGLQTTPDLIEYVAHSLAFPGLRQVRSLSSLAALLWFGLYDDNTVVELGVRVQVCTRTELSNQHNEIIMEG
jgi:hypothetical protein